MGYRMLFLVVLVCLVQANGEVRLANAKGGGSDHYKDVFAEIDQPEPGQLLGDTTEIWGDVICVALRYWTLSYKNNQDSEWTEIARSYDTAFRYVGWLADWDTSELAEGEYSLRLQLYGPRIMETEAFSEVTMAYVPCGDIDGDWDVDIYDVHYFEAWLFEGGPAPFQMRAADCDLSGRVDIGDVQYLIDFLKNNGPAPCESNKVKSAGIGVPGPSLSGNFPNPFNPQTTIAFELPNEQAVSLSVYDVSGRLVNVLIDNEVATRGRNEVVWRGLDMMGRVVPAGVYFYRLEAGSYSETKRMVLVK